MTEHELVAGRPENIVPMSEKPAYLVAKDKDGVVQIISETATYDKNVANTEASKRAMDNGSDYLVVKIISRHKKRVSTDVISYE